MADQATTIARWLRPFVLPSSIVGVRLPASLTASHVNTNDKYKAVQDFDLRGLDESGLASLARDVDETLSGDAAGLGGVQRYALECKLEDGSVVARRTLRFRGADDDKDDEALTEPANARGLTSQAMRHSEALMRVNQMGFGSIIAAQGRMIEMLSGMAEKAMEKQTELMGLVEEGFSLRHEREMDAMERAAKVEQRGKIAAGAVPLIAAVVQKYTGVTIAGALPPEVVQFRSFLGNLEDSQLQSFLQLLTPDQQIVILSFLEQEKEREESAPNGRSKQ